MTSRRASPTLDRRSVPDERGDSPGKKMTKHALTLSYDKESDAAYLRFSSPLSGERVGRGRTVNLSPDGKALPDWVKGGLVIDYDAEGRIMGFEFLRPSRQFRPDLLERLSREADAAEPPV